MVETNVMSLGVTLKKIGPFSMDTFEDRLLFQKRIYLLQAFSFYFGYKFKWYIHGPYSTQLAKEGYKLIPIYDKIPNLKFRNDYVKKFKDFMEFLGERKNDSIWLSQLACTHFLKNIHPEYDKEEIIRLVQEHEKHYSEEESRRAFDYLVRHGMINNGRR